MFILNLTLSRSATTAGTKADTSPPMPAICRTKVALMGRTDGDAGRNTVSTSGAIAAIIPASCINRKIVECDSGELATLRANHDAAGLLQHCDALIGRKQRRLAGMHPDRNHQPAGEPRSVAHHVDMAVGHRIERAWIEGNRLHRQGLARRTAVCKAAACFTAPAGSRNGLVGPATPRSGLRPGCIGSAAMRPRVRPWRPAGRM